MVRYIGLFLFSASSLFALGNVDSPSQFIDLGKIIVAENPYNKEKREALVLLPYIKPEGVIYVWYDASENVVIHSIIADGKKVRAKSLWPQESPEPSSVYDAAPRRRSAFYGNALDRRY